jgi:hypothetical protein
MLLLTLFSEEGIDLKQFFSLPVLYSMYHSSSFGRQSADLEMNK